ncbi:2-hydroxyacid dehydrogenase [Aldersonia sp. NBC_00410]|uniref:2-hydroxyacid dehydrogenase n=1 Tax=Aldersonia sp. NBC_00410 TaxID=2975954 RepID=UPI002250FBEF|nr:2-hydroxyacid dehydrogenase [Aldersonia sp. NBC_00410]MCX5046478.1 2-hydroxyacid dehydrogenase [Aldersonia sp. NBC_00410]
MKIVVGDRNLLPHRVLFESLLPAGSEVRWLPDGNELADADVYVGGRFTAAQAQAAPKLRLVHVAGAGTDKVEFAALGPDTVVANTFHHENSIAEYIVAAAVMMRRGFLAQDRALRTDRWASSVYDDTLAQPRSLGGAKVGFVGYGHIGRRAWELLRAFGAEGRAVTGRGNVDAASHGLSWAEDNSALTRLLREVDLVVVSAPLTESTRGMIGADQLNALGGDGVLINVGRGPLVDEQALYEALTDRTIAGAAIDVWYSYPGDEGRGAPSAFPFADLPNVLMTPHSSGVTGDTFVGRVHDIAENIGRLDRGEPLLRIVDGTR